MNAYQTADSDRDSLDREQALADCIVDSARECGTDRACDWCPHYHVTVGVCHYGSQWPECRVGRILSVGWRERSNTSDPYSKHEQRITHETR